MTRPAAQGPGKARSGVLRTLTDAVFLFISPADILGSIGKRTTVWQPAQTVLFWGFLAGLLESTATLSGMRIGTQDPVQNVMTVALMPVFFMIFAGVITLLYHALTRLAGATAPIRQSALVVAALIPLLTIDILLGSTALIRLPMLLYKFYLAALAAELVNHAPRRRARRVFGSVCALLLLINAWLAFG